MPPSRRPLAALLSVLLVALLLAAVVPGGVAAAQVSERSRPLPAAAVGSLSPELVGVALEGADYLRAAGAWDAAGAALDDAEDAERRTVFDRDRAEQGFGARVVDLARLDEALARRQAERAEQATRLESATETTERARRRLVELAVHDFVAGGPTTTNPLDLPTLADAGRRDLLVHLAERSRIAEHADAEGAEAVARADERTAAEAEGVASVELEVGSLARDEAASSLEVTHAKVLDAARVRDRRAVEVQHRLDALIAAVPTAEVVDSDLDVVVLDAYLRAGRDRGAACGLPWTVLAGIGRVESGHGTAQGASVGLAGAVTPRIIGIPLDGSNGTRNILDTDAGLLDGDVVVDRAVGPMQFIPTTWGTVGVDGNVDGVVDPHNLYDTAASAAAYLCRAMPAEGGYEGLRRAVLAYNHSEAYVDDVLEGAVRYQAVLPA